MLSPLHEIKDRVFETAGVQVFVKRDDLAKPLGSNFDAEFAGNKWRKLKYNIEVFKADPELPILSFGGAYSNHLYALAAVSEHYEFSTIAIVRGEEEAANNPTLSFCRARGMQLLFVSRSEYRRRWEATYLEDLRARLGDFHLLPEGGSNQLALRGMRELVEECRSVQAFSHICCPVGTGASLAGIISGLQQEEYAIGFSALKGNFLAKQVQSFLEVEGRVSEQWHVETGHHFGGYAKHNEALVQFMRHFYTTQEIRLDPIYTAKMFAGLYQLLRDDYFPRGSKIVLVHTGGLQGINGFEARNGLCLFP